MADTKRFDKLYKKLLELKVNDPVEEKEIRDELLNALITDFGSNTNPKINSKQEVKDYYNHVNNLVKNPLVRKVLGLTNGEVNFKSIGIAPIKNQRAVKPKAPKTKAPKANAKITSAKTIIPNEVQREIK